MRSNSAALRPRRERAYCREKLTLSLKTRLTLGNSILQYTVNNLFWNEKSRGHWPLFCSPPRQQRDVKILLSFWILKFSDLGRLQKGILGERAGFRSTWRCGDVFQIGENNRCRDVKVQILLKPKGPQKHQDIGWANSPKHQPELLKTSNFILPQTLYYSQRDIHFPQDEAHSSLRGILNRYTYN